MVLVDTSVWIDHLKYGNVRLSSLLSEGHVACHPFIIGELACGSLKNRQEILSLLKVLPEVTVIDLNEFIYFVEKNLIASKGIGFVDIHLLASAKIDNCHLWTIDKKLKETADLLGISLPAAF